MLSAATSVLSIQVRDLVEFVCRTGDLGTDRDFIGPNRAVEGTRGHQRLQRSRPAGYEKEVRLSHDVVAEGFTVRVQGRLDGVLRTGPEVLIEEIKTVLGQWDGAANPLHWAQAKVYGFIYAQTQSLEAVTLRLAYLNLDSGKVTEFSERFTRDELATFFADTTAIYIEWLQEHFHWCRQRDQSIRAVAFPFAGYRPGQREIAVASYRAIVREQRLFVAAPTGIGKTISVLFPAVKALAEGKVERIFYLTARTTARAIAEKAFADLREAGLRLRTLTLTAKEKICVQQGQPCDLAECPLARGYYDRRRPAMRAALAEQVLTRPVLEQIAREHQVCPFELGLDISLWVDAVVADYNYVFDPQVYLRRHFDEPGNYVFLVDEAHNLVDRSREMFSADLGIQEIKQVQRALQQSVPRCARALSKLSSAMRKLSSPGATAVEVEEPSQPGVELNLFPIGTSAPPLAPVSLRAAPGQATTISRAESGVRVLRQFPTELLPLIEEALAQAETWLGRNEPAEFRADLLGLYFRLVTFARTADRADDRFRTIVTPGQDLRVTLFCLDPSFLLRQALERGKAAIFFSATLTPLRYYGELLGGSPEDPTLDLPSPFPSENLAVLVQDRIGTSYKTRGSTLGEIADAIGGLVEERRGNYLVYFPSYQYLAAVQELFVRRFPAVLVRVQRPGMSDAERDGFLAAFAADLAQTQVGFAVMGGVFGEGVDLVGDRLIGAVIVGVGLPQLGVQRDLIREYFQEKVGAGFDYAYTFPGMNRVLQAIGRVIRSETDRGVALLIDTRFAEQRYRQLFPPWWRPVSVRTAQGLQEALRQFWK